MTVENQQKQSLKGRTAVITGAGKGLGKDMALALAQAGVNLALAGRNTDSLRVVAEAAKKHGVSAEAFAADVTREQDVLDLERSKQR